MADDGLTSNEIPISLLPPVPPAVASSRPVQPSGPRLARSVINGELRQPLDTLGRSLQRLSIQHVSAPGSGGSPAAHLLRRARTLVEELDLVVSELAELAAPAPGPVMRSGQERIPLLGLLDGVVREVGSHFDRPHILDCPDDLAVTTDPARLRAILVNVIAATARNADVEGFDVGASITNRNVEITATWRADTPAREILDGDPGLALAQTLTRSLGGEFTAADGAGTERVVRLVFPQQRDGDTG